EAACYKEVESAERDAVEDGIEEYLLAADCFLKPRRPHREDQPKQQRNRDQGDQRPGRVALDEPAHACPPAVPVSRCNAQKTWAFCAVAMLSSRASWPFWLAIWIAHCVVS